MFALFIIIRILFIACIILVIGYVFGNFSKSKALTTLTKVASILLIVLFAGAAAFSFRSARHNGYGTYEKYNHCITHTKDSVQVVK